MTGRNCASLAGECPHLADTGSLLPKHQRPLTLQSSHSTKVCGCLECRRNQPPAAQAFGNVPLGAHQDVVAVARPVHRYFTVAGAQVAAHLDAFYALARAEPPDDLSFISLVYARVRFR